ncbi:MAG: alanine dehydrogenase [Alphaproteobacteria bacterium CG_4_10_14_0_2_um_filter_63_37]|nr:MAG: alanine dehydrogenase [Proteobacteria bacterium CG1_02_64_396]PJA25778.1 MAG: alanine dehydrogenase [Alphaproteobacteria bacterium CG_4_10_14_0_2_um_filter_63_37]
MIVGIPQEIKDHEYRVALTPDGAHELVQAGHEVRVQRGAGVGSGFADTEYEAAGAHIVAAEQAWAAALVVKVKEPLPSEYRYLRPNLLLFTFLHLAAVPELTQVLLKTRTRAIGYETVQLPDGRLPLLAPMSQVAGRLAVQAGAHHLEREQGGSGILLGGVPGVAPGRVTVLGAGNVGLNAVRIAVGMGAMVTLLDLDHGKLTHAEALFDGRIVTLVASRGNVARSVAQADLVVGAVLIAGAKAPTLIDRAMLRSMRPGSVLADVAIDQGGVAETSRPTTHSAPTFVEEGVVHYCVANMPGAVPRTSTLALTGVTLPYVKLLADAADLGALIAARPDLEAGVNTWDGALCCAAVAG